MNAKKWVQPLSPEEFALFAQGKKDFSRQRIIATIRQLRLLYALSEGAIAYLAFFNAISKAGLDYVHERIYPALRHIESGHAVMGANGEVERNPAVPLPKPRAKHKTKR